MRPSLLTFETVGDVITTGHGYYFQEVWRDENGKIVKYGEFWQHSYYENWYMGYNDRKEFFRIPLPSDIEFEKLIQVGRYGLIAIPRKGVNAELDRTIYCYGENSVGRLGLGDVTDRRDFVPFNFKEIDSKIKSIIRITSPQANNTHGCVYAFALMEDGTKNLYGTGRNGNGELGIGNKNQYNTWQLVMPNIKNYWHTDGSSVTIQKHDDKFVACGRNGMLMTGIGNTYENAVFKDLVVQPNPTSEFNSMSFYSNGSGQYQNWRGCCTTLIDGCIHLTGSNYDGSVPNTNTQLIDQFTKITIDGKPLMPLKDDQRYYRAYFWGQFWIGYIGEEGDTDRRKGIFYTGYNGIHGFKRIAGYTQNVYELEFYPDDLDLEDLEIVSFDQTKHFSGNYPYAFLLFVNKKARRVWNVGEAQFDNKPIVKTGYEIQLPQIARECVYFECKVWVTSHVNDGGIIFIFDNEVWAMGWDSEHFWVTNMGAQTLMKQFEV